MRVVVFLVWGLAGLCMAEEARLDVVCDFGAVFSVVPQTPEVFMTLPEARCLEGDWEYGIGGLEDGEASRRVWRRHQVLEEVQPLPDLPFPLAYASAAVWSNYVCVVGGLRHVRRHEFNYDVWMYDASANKQVWRSLGRLEGAGRIRPSLFHVRGGLFCAGGWLGVTTASREVVYVPLGSIWQVLPKRAFGEVLDQGVSLGSPLVGSLGGLFWQCPAVREVRSLEDVLLRRYAIDRKALRFSLD